MPSKSPSLVRSITSSVDAPAALAPVFDELFAGIDALGSMPKATVRELMKAGLEPDARVLDLACGKGAVAVEVARRIGCRLDGIDACEAFIASARELAGSKGVADRCRFRVGDVATLHKGGYDAAMMLGLYPLPEAALLLRRLTRKGGVYVIDDCWWDDALADPPNTECFTKEQSLEIVEAIGDRVERIVTPTPSAVRTLNAHLYAALKANVRRLEHQHSKLRKPLRKFLENQREANRLLGDVLRPALWVIRRV